MYDSTEWMIMANVPYCAFPYEIRSRSCKQSSSQDSIRGGKSLKQSDMPILEALCTLWQHHGTLLE